MIYPIINIDQINDSCSIEVYDTQFNSNPLLALDCDFDIENSLETFYCLLTAFVNQYNDGYNDGIESMEEEYEL